MSIEMLLALALAIFLVGTGIGYVLRKIIAQQQKNSIELEIQKKLLEAKSASQGVILEAKSKAAEILEEAKTEEKKRGADIHKWEERLAHKEETLEKKSGELDVEKKDLKEKVERVRQVQEALKHKEEEKEKELERIHKLELSGEDRLSRKARDILASVIQRVASSTASEVTTTSVTIPSEDLKGKIIGREGRNIRALERAAGVEIIVDDTPGSI